MRPRSQPKCHSSLETGVRVNREATHWGKSRCLISTLGPVWYFVTFRISVLVGCKPHAAYDGSHRASACKRLHAHHRCAAQPLQTPKPAARSNWPIPGPAAVARSESSSCAASDGPWRALAQPRTARQHGPLPLPLHTGTLWYEAGALVQGSARTPKASTMISTRSSTPRPLVRIPETSQYLFDCAAGVRGCEPKPHWRVRRTLSCNTALCAFALPQAVWSGVAANPDTDVSFV